MSEILLEDLGNLNRIDKSLVLFNDQRSKQLMYLGATGITENSRVEVDRITPHNFTTLMTKLDEDNSIGAIVVRAHGRQLCLVSKLQLYAQHNYQYFLKFSNYAIDKLDMRGYYSYSGFLKNDRMAPIKTAISRCVKAFYDNVAPEGTRKNWDTVIIYKDETVQGTLDKRRKQKQGIIPTPHDENYGDFINNLKNSFNQKCQEYLDKVRVNSTNAEEIVNYLMNRKSVEKFKFNGCNYEKYDSDYARVGQTFNVTYKRIESGRNIDNQVNPLRIRLVFDWNGYVPYVENVLYTNSSYIYSDDAYEPLSELDKL